MSLQSWGLKNELGTCIVYCSLVLLVPSLLRHSVKSLTFSVTLPWFQVSSGPHYRHTLYLPILPLLLLLPFSSPLLSPTPLPPPSLFYPLSLPIPIPVPLLCSLSYSPLLSRLLSYLECRGSRTFYAEKDNRENVWKTFLSEELASEDLLLLDKWAQSSSGFSARYCHCPTLSPMLLKF